MSQRRRARARASSLPHGGLLLCTNVAQLGNGQFEKRIQNERRGESRSARPSAKKQTKHLRVRGPARCGMPLGARQAATPRAPMDWRGEEARDGGGAGSRCAACRISQSLWMRLRSFHLFILSKFPLVNGTEKGSELSSD